MNLLFDLTASQPNGSGKRHGGGKYCEVLFLSMIEKKIKFKAFYDSARYINPILLDKANQYNIEIYDIQENSLSTIVTNHNISHLYSALPELIRPWPNCKILGTIHGLRSYEMPFDFFSNWQFDSGLIGFNTISAYYFHLKNKRAIKKYYQTLLHTDQFDFITVSEHSKQIIQQICPQKNIPVFYSPSTSTECILTQKTDPFFLLVSANRVEKNCIRAIIALDELYSERSIPTAIKVKITGLSRPSFRYQLKNPNQFSFLDYVDEIELAHLYANCWCFIYPSLNEGFGYPPLEAMQYGVPVIASNLSSIPEVCGEAALYVNPKSIRQLKNKIIAVTSDQTYKNLSQKSLNQYKLITRRQKDDTEKLINWIIAHMQSSPQF